MARELRKGPARVAACVIADGARLLSSWSLALSSVASYQVASSQSVPLARGRSSVCLRPRVGRATASPRPAAPVPERDVRIWHKQPDMDGESRGGRGSLNGNSPEERARQTSDRPVRQINKREFEYRVKVNKREFDSEEEGANKREFD